MQINIRLQSQIINNLSRTFNDVSSTISLYLFFLLFSFLFSYVYLRSPIICHHVNGRNIEIHWYCVFVSHMSWMSYLIKCLSSYSFPNILVSASNAFKRIVFLCLFSFIKNSMDL